MAYPDIPQADNSKIEEAVAAVKRHQQERDETHRKVVALSDPFVTARFMRVN